MPIFPKEDEPKGMYCRLKLLYAIFLAGNALEKVDEQKGLCFIKEFLMILFQIKRRKSKMMRSRN